jgi:hypothetical protein
MTHTDTLDQHVREYYLYHDEQTKFFDDLASTNKPVDAGLDEYAALQWCEQMHDLTGTWNADVWSEKGWW